MSVESFPKPANPLLSVQPAQPSNKSNPFLNPATAAGNPFQNKSAATPNAFTGVNWLQPAQQ